jgi:hypothetical protein
VPQSWPVIRKLRAHRPRLVFQSEFARRLCHGILLPVRSLPTAEHWYTANICVLCNLQLMYSDLDERNITELSKFDASVALEILEHYCSGDLTQVRNRRAYLAGKQLRPAAGVRALSAAAAGACCRGACCVGCSGWGARPLLAAAAGASCSTAPCVGCIWHTPNDSAAPIYTLHRWGCCQKQQRHVCLHVARLGLRGVRSLELLVF